MKKLLCLLTSATLLTSTVVPTAVLLNNNFNSKIENQDVEQYLLNSFENIVKVYNLQFTDQEILDTNKDVAEVIAGAIPDYYNSGFNGQMGTIRGWDMTPLDNDQNIWTFSHSFRNDSPFEQTYDTWAYEKKVTNTHSFSVSITEKTTTKINIKGKITIPFLNKIDTGSGEIGGGLEVDFEFGQQKQWTDTETETITITAPSQKIKASSKSILNVLYTIKQGLFLNKGIVNFEVTDLTAKKFKVPHFWFDENGNYKNPTWDFLSVTEITDMLKSSGYSEQLQSKKSNYSILTVDNIQDPQKFYLNLPVTWESQGGKIDISHYETPIN